MNGIDQLSSAVCTRIVLTFAHFLWQGVAIAILGQALAWAAARHSARLRYGIYVISLSIMVLAVLVTYGLLDLPLVPKPLRAQHYCGLLSEGLRQLEPPSRR